MNDANDSRLKTLDHLDFLILYETYTLPNLSPLELEFQVEYQTQLGIPI